MLQNFQTEDIQPDSSGLMYNQSYHNLPLADYFIDIQYIHHSTPTKHLNNQTSHVQSTVSDLSGDNLSFNYSDFVLFLLILMFSIIAYVRISGKNYFNRLLMSLQNYSYSLSFFREKNLAYILYNNLLIIVFYLSSSLLGSIFADYFHLALPFQNKYLQLLFILFSIGSLIFLNRIAIRISGLIFGQYKLAAEYLFYYSNLLKALGVIFLFLLVALYFMNKNSFIIFIFIGLFVSIVVYLVKVIRVLIIFFNNRFSLYYLILYFCALEIIPAVLIIKLFRHILQNGADFWSTLV